MNWIVQNLWLIPGLPLLAATLALVDARQNKRPYLRRHCP